MLLDCLRCASDDFLLFEKKLRAVSHLNFYPYKSFPYSSGRFIPIDFFNDAFDRVMHKNVLEKTFYDAARFSSNMSIAEKEIE